MRLWPPPVVRSLLSKPQRKRHRARLQKQPPKKPLRVPPGKPQPPSSPDQPRAVNLLAQRINAALPQTQCTRCGYPDCAAYAQAISGGEAGINQCPPGGAEGITRLAALTGRPVLPLNPVNGNEGPRHLAVIDEA